MTTRQVANNDATTKRATRFVIGNGRSVVTNMWIGECDDLTRVTGVGHYFLISTQHRIENDFSGRNTTCRLCSDGLAFKDTAVSENERRFTNCHHHPYSA